MRNPFARVILLSLMVPALLCESSDADEGKQRGSCVTLSSEAYDYDFETDESHRSTLFAQRCCARSEFEEYGANRSCSAQIRSSRCTNNVCNDDSQTVQVSSIKAVGPDGYAVAMPDGSTVTFTRTSSEAAAVCESSRREGLSDVEFATCRRRGRGFLAVSDYVHDPSITVAPFETIAVEKSHGRLVDFPWFPGCYCDLPLYVLEWYED